jgi:alkylation response protein AidB-like acyl-CoA dehydrogenase
MWDVIAAKGFEKDMFFEQAAVDIRALPKLEGTVHVNIGKYNLGWSSIGMCTHALYEAIHHASNRRLYNMYVTDFPHVKQLFTDAYARLTAMKLFALRAADYMRVASPEDRRYLLYNPMVKMSCGTSSRQKASRRTCFSSRRPWISVPYRSSKAPCT